MNALASLTLVVCTAAFAASPAYQPAAPAPPPPAKQGTSIGEQFFCSPDPNSTGVSGVLEAYGSDVVTDNDVTLHASDLPQNSFGFAIVSRTQAPPACPGSCLLCIGGDIGRYLGPSQIQNSGASGSFDIVLDMTQVPTPTGFVSALAGDTWNFQVWYRDFHVTHVDSHFTNGHKIDFL